MKYFFSIAILAVSAHAQGALITYSGAVDPAARGDWEITILQGSFEEYTSHLESQIWFGNGALARQFAELLGDVLGFPNPDDAGPIFAWSYNPEGISPVTARAVFAYEPSVGINIGLSDMNEFSWANAVESYSDLPSQAQACDRPAQFQNPHCNISSVPEPSSITLLAAVLLALNFVRRRNQKTWCACSAQFAKMKKLG